MSVREILETYPASWSSTPASAQTDESQDGNEIVAAFLARREYYAGLGPVIWGPATDDREAQFVIRLRQCEDAAAATPSSDPSAIGAIPEIESVPELIAYAFEVNEDQVVVADGLRALRLVTAMRQEPRIDDAACRSLVRRSLQEDYGLEARLNSDAGRVVVNRLDWPGPPPEPVVLSAPGIDVDPTTLGRYTGFFARPSSESTTLTPIFHIRREGRTLSIEWQGERFELAATSPTEFSAPEYLTWSRQQQLAAIGIFGSGQVQTVAYAPDGRRVFVSTDAPTLDLQFDVDGNGVSIVNDHMQRNWPAGPIGRARRIDADTAEAAIAELERRRAQSLPDSESDSLVQALAASLVTAGAPDDSTATAATRQMREHLEQTMPDLADRLGNLRDVSLREVLPSGRDVYDVVYDGLAMRITIGTDAAGSAVPLTFDIDCQRQSESHIERFGGCRAR
jgi:hypothetical protein